MTLLLDSSLLIGHLRGEAGCTAFLENHLGAGTDLRASVVTWAELLAGERLDAEGENAVRALLGLFRGEPVTQAVGAAAGRLLRAHALARGLRLADALIAATALELDCPVATLDHRHLANLPGLLIVVPPHGTA